MNICSLVSSLKLLIRGEGPRCQTIVMRISSHTLGGLSPERFKRASFVLLNVKYIG
jgi:hypothetical protein